MGAPKAYNRVYAKVLEGVVFEFWRLRGWLVQAGWLMCKGLISFDGFHGLTVFDSSKDTAETVARGTFLRSLAKQR
jgi:hypothetical protein